MLVGWWTRGTRPVFGIDRGQMRAEPHWALLSLFKDEGRS